MMRLRNCCVLSLLVAAVSCGDKPAPGPTPGPTPSGTRPPAVVRDLDPLSANFDDCSLAECAAVGAALMQGLADKRYTGQQVGERQAFLGTAQIAELGKLRPDLVPSDPGNVPTDAELVRIRQLGFASDAQGLAELKRIADSDSVRPAYSLTALAALARRGDKGALRSLESEEDVESLTLWLDVVRESGIAKIVQMFVGQDPMEFERALQLVEQIEERAFDGMVDPTGLEIGAALHKHLVDAQVDLARLTAIVTAVPGCRTAAMARKVLEHPDFAELPRMVEQRGPLLDLLSLIEVVDLEQLRIRVREVSEHGDQRVQGFWLARRLDLGDEEVVDRWIERLQTDEGVAFFPGYPVLAQTRAPVVGDFLMQRLRDQRLRDNHGSIDIYQALAVMHGLPIAARFPADNDIKTLGAKAAEPILKHLREGRAEEALLAFLDAWDFKQMPELEWAPLGESKSAAILARLRQLASDPKLPLKHELLAALAASGDKQARAEHLGFLRSGILGFRERVSPLSLTLGTSPETLPLLLTGVSTVRVLSEKLVMDVYPIFGLAIDPGALPSRRLLRYELSGNKLLKSRIAHGLILGPETPTQPGTTETKK